MHDAPPPPLDRRGIGRFGAGTVSDADMLLNEAICQRLRTHLEILPGGVRHTAYPSESLE